MASKGERIQSEYKRELMEITNCCICNSTVKDPRILPCIHTFCLKCLKSKVADSDSTTTDIIVCPLCKSEFMIPESGFVGLQKNFFVERLATMCEALNKLTILNICDICCENVNPSNSTDIHVVEAYCKSCDFRMCRNCCKQHRVSKPTKAHKLYTLQGSDTLNSSTEEIAECVCDEHQNERLKIYCTDCNNVLCALCYIKLHEGHKWLYLSKAADEFRCEMKTSIDCLLDTEMTKRLENFEIEKLDFQQKTESILEKTQTVRMQLKDAVDKHAEAIFEGIDSLKLRRETYIESEHNELLRVENILERFRNYCQDITTKGSVIDICRSIGDLRMNFTDLMKLKDSTNEKCFHPFQEQEFLEILNSDDYNFFRRFHDDLAAVTKSEQDFETTLHDILRCGRKSDEPRNYKKTVQVKHEATKYSDQDILKVVDSRLQESHFEHSRPIMEKDREEWDTIGKFLYDKVNEKESQRSLNQLKQSLEDTERCLKKLEDDRNSLLKQIEELKINQAKEITKPVAREIKVDAKDHALELQAKTRQADKKHQIGMMTRNQKPLLVHTIATTSTKDTGILGLTILGNELFLIHRLISNIEIYDSTTFCFKKKVHVKGLTNPQDIVSCHDFQCLYIMDLQRTKYIMRLDHTGNLIRKWSTGNDGGRLSVTKNSTLIVTFYYDNQLREYTYEGEVVSQVKFSTNSGIVHPWHAVELTNGHFAVCFGRRKDSESSVCIVDRNGESLLSFSGKRESSVGKLNCPVYLAADSAGNIIVADQNNGRLLLLSPQVKFIRELVSVNVKGVARRLSKFYLDEFTGKLFLADNGWNWDVCPGKVLVFDFA